MIETAKTRRDVWDSRDAARKWMVSRLPWKTWTPRAVDLFVVRTLHCYGFSLCFMMLPQEYALCDLPTPAYPNRADGVTLCCTRVQETVGYIYYQDAIDAINRVSELCQAIPVHTISGSKIDIVYVSFIFFDEFADS
jgi:hypothetical protein